ncbi:MAG: hypothetical protein ABIN97_16940, partial [Ginsengibacter sp.]
MKKYIGFLFSLLIAMLIIAIVAMWQGLDSFVFAWTLNFMLMLSGLSMTRTFKPKLASDYFNSKKWENEGKIYKWFGINIFRALLVWVGWEKLNKAANPVKKNFNALKHLEYSTRESEFGHLVIFFIVLSIAVFVGFYYGFRKSLWLHILNVILHVYPIATQRYNRPRLR